MVDPKSFTLKTGTGISVDVQGLTGFYSGSVSIDPKNVTSIRLTTQKDIQEAVDRYKGQKVFVATLRSAPVVIEYQDGKDTRRVLVNPSSEPQFAAVLQAVKEINSEAIHLRSDDVTAKPAIRPNHGPRPKTTAYIH